MSKSTPQSFKNHGRIDPAFHLILAPILLANLIWALVHLSRQVNFDSVWLVVLSAAGIVLYTLVRTYPLKVQDRVIRLEERLRLQSLAPAAWQPQISRLSEDQLIGLRFASDEEVVALADEALASGLNRKQIKERIKNWRADNFRI